MRSRSMEMQQRRPALFLDRDGVINVEKNYVHRIEDFEFMDGIFELCRGATAAGMAVVVVTNQAGIGRGHYSVDQFLVLTEWMCGRFADAGVGVDAVYYCPHHPDYGLGKYRADSFDRKPNPGMILRARDELNLSLENSVLVGDKASDIAAARAASVGRAVLLAAHAVAITPAPDIQAGSLRAITALLFGDTRISSPADITWNTRA